MPHGEKIARNEWEKINKREQNRGGDVITERALAALDVDSSDESDCLPVSEVKCYYGNQPSHTSDEERSEASIIAAEQSPEKDTRLTPSSDETEQQGINEGSDQPARNQYQEVIDLTLNSSDEEDLKPAVVIVKPRGKPPSISAPPDLGGICDSNANNVHEASFTELSKGTGLAILDEFRVVKTAPASQRLPFLNGKLSISNNGQSHQLVLRGVWGYEKKPDYTPQRFELISDRVSEDLGSYTLPSTCSFNGIFVYHDTPIEERNVIICFQASEGGFRVKGSGTNQFGIFELNGTAEWLNKNDEPSFSLMVNKIYTKSFPPADEKPKATKRKSETDLDSNTETKRHVQSSRSVESDKLSLIKELHVHRAGHKSTESFPLLTDERTPDVLVEKAQDGARKNRPTVFDQIQYAERDVMKPTPKSPCTESILRLAKQQPISTPSVNQLLGNDTCRRQINQRWHEFGSLSNATPTKLSPVTSETKHHLSWKVEDISRPSFPKNTLDFCASAGIHFVNDLLKADDGILVSYLMSFKGFKAACALYAWKSKQLFYNVYKTSLAQRSIKKWKAVARLWFKRTVGSDWKCKEGRLSCFLSSHEASFLETNFGIASADQLLMSNYQDILDRLRQVKIVSNYAEGMFYSWIMRAQERSNTAFGHQRNALVDSMKLSLSNPSTKSGYSSNTAAHDVHVMNVHSIHRNSELIDLTGDSHDQTLLSPPLHEEHAITTPMSIFEYLFLRSQHITSEDQLGHINVQEIAAIYFNYLRSHGHKTNIIKASRIVSRWKTCALTGHIADRSEDTPFSNRIDKSPENCKVMYTISNLSNIAMINGSPTKTIYTFDDESDVLYAFQVNIEKSRVAQNSGNGAFFTFKGAKILKQSSYWKRKKRSEMPYLPQTRRELTAVFREKGSASVSLRGKNIHGDEWFYGPDDGIGLFNEFTLDDFIDVKNVTYSSKHPGCAMIELDRYAPLLPEDRKPDFIFGFKDFIYSHEPSSWRFDVDEELNGHKQVVDFTDDKTGCPHSVARSRIAMYVNEVGHNDRLVENVWPLGDGRSVSYYVMIDKPMIKGETVELLVNYGKGYEEMRTRRGYGKLNADGIESDENDFARVMRNLLDRKGVEESAMSCSEEDIQHAIEFFADRVWNGIVASKGQTDLLTLRRQHIARRRLNWLASKFRIRLLQLSSECDSASYDGKEFYEGMFIYVNGWMPEDDPRPPYTGIATVNKISTDQHNNKVFHVLIPSSQKTIHSVPEGAVTLPTEEDFANMSNTVLRTWRKHRQEKHRIQIRAQMLNILDKSFQWNASYILQAHSDTRDHLLKDYRWEISEELLYLMTKYNRMTEPFDTKKWCPLARTLLMRMLHAIADFTLVQDKKDIQVLCRNLLSLARQAVRSIQELAKGDLTELNIQDLSFLRKHNTSIIIVHSIKRHKLSVDEYLKAPQKLDVEWYICCQIIMVAYPLLSSIWQEGNACSLLPMLCEQVGIDHNSPYLTLAHTIEAFTPLVRLC